MFPQVVSHNEPLVKKVEDVRASVKWQLKKVTCLAAAVGNVKMDDEQLRQNIMMSLNFLVSLTKKGWHNIKSVTIKTTMGKPVKLLWATWKVLGDSYLTQLAKLCFLTDGDNFMLVLLGS